MYIKFHTNNILLFRCVWYTGQNREKRKLIILHFVDIRLGQDRTKWDKNAFLCAMKTGRTKIRHIRQNSPITELSMSN